jgi:hypothetical protein
MGVEGHAIMSRWHTGHRYHCSKPHLSAQPHALNEAVVVSLTFHRVGCGGSTTDSVTKLSWRLAARVIEYSSLGSQNGHDGLDASRLRNRQRNPVRM